MTEPRTAQTVELLQELIRNECVNDGTVESGQEVRNCDLLVTFLEGSGLDLETYEAAPGRTSMVARLEGSDPNAPSLCLNGHTDVVPITPEGWSRDPFAGDLVDGEVWGRGAVDMLNLTASMAVVMRDLALSGKRPKGDLVFLAVADEEAGSIYGAQYMAEHHAEAITTDYVLTESGGLHYGSADAPSIGINVGEKGVSWRRLTVRGTPGHGSMPFRSDNALMKAAAVVQRIGDYRPPARFHELWRGSVEALELGPEITEILLDADRIDAWLDEFPVEGIARFLHACTHTTFSPNVSVSQTKTNIIPDTVTIDVDIRTLPGETAADVEEHLKTALGAELAAQVEIEPITQFESTSSQINNPLWDALARAMAHPFPSARPVPTLTVGFTDARVHRELGAIAYGAGLLSPNLNAADFSARFHGNDERIDVESLGLTTQFFRDVCTDLLW